MPAPSILVVDDETSIRSSLQEILQEEGWRADALPNGEDCLKAVSRSRYDLILLDVWLKGIDGLEVLRRLKEREDAPAVIMISGHGTIETAVKATKLGAFDFLEKPLSMEKTLLLVRHALEQLRLAQENRRLREQLRTRYRIIGESAPLKALRQQLALTAPTNARVLIFGESGTGKELVARALHAGSLRAAQPLVEVNCAAIPEDLIESELFGHVRGAFTGATDDKVGKFQQADGGTLFLDEIADMSLRTQSKVLRVLEEQRIEPLGSGRTVQVDTRVIAATNKNLEEEIAQGRFREDLFYRLNVIPFHVPALRERIEDIPLLGRYFLEQFASAYGRCKKELSVEALELLQNYPWPGNVRELKNIIERLVIMVPQEHIEKSHLPPEFFRRGDRAATAAATLEEAWSVTERQFIVRKLQENKWNVTRTAAAIDVERSHLHRKMRALGISPQRKDRRQ